METVDKTLTNKRVVNLQQDRLVNLDSALSQLPSAFDEWISSLNALSSAGTKIGSLLEIILDVSPLHQIAEQYKTLCDNLHDKYTNKETVITQEFVTLCQQVGPLVNSLRSSLSSRDKIESKFISASNRLNSVSSSDSKSKAKVDQAELKYENTFKDLNEQDRILNKTSDHLEMKIEQSLGSWFLNIVQVQCTLLTDTADVMSTLNTYKGFDISLFPSLHPSIKEVTLQWLATSQVNTRIRSSKDYCLPTHYIQHLTFNGTKLPEYSRNTINPKIDTILKNYISELSDTVNVTRTVSGGFHLNSQGIQLALKDCCSHLEVLSASTPRAVSRQEKEELIEKDVPFSSYRIDSKILTTTSRVNDIHDSIQEKLMFIEKLASTLSESQSVSSDKLQEYTFLVLSESCASLIQNASKTAVQLLYGKAHLVTVRLSSNDQHIIEIKAKDESTLLITASYIWCIVEDYMTLSPLSRPVMTADSYLATVETIYSLELNLTQFIENQSSFLSIPNIQVKCTSTNSNYFSQISTSRTKRSPHRNNRHAHHSSDADHSSSSGGRLSSSSSDLQDDSDSAHTITSPSLDPPPLENRRGPPRLLPRSNSSDSIHSVSTTATLKATNQYEEGEDDILSMLTSTSHGLTHNILQEHTTKETKPTNPRKYSSLRKAPPTLPQWGNEGGSSEGRGSDEMLEIVGKTKKIDKSHSTSSLLNNKYTPATSDDFDNVFKYLGGNGTDNKHNNGGNKKSGYSFQHRDHYLQNQPHSSRHENDQLTDNFNTNEDLISSALVGGGASSQVILGRGEDEGEEDGRHGNTHIVSNSTCSLDSGIGGHHYRNNGNSLKRNGRSNEDNNNWESFYNHRCLGPFLPLPSDSSDSDTASGRNSRDNNFQSSQEDIPGRSSSRSSFHSLGGGRPGSRGGDSDTFSLPDMSEPPSHFISSTFNQAPGSHRGSGLHRRHPSLSYDPLSQEGYETLPSRGSFSQELPLPRSQDGLPTLERDFLHHHNSGPTPSGHFSHSYDQQDPSLGMRPNNSQYLSDPYPGPPPPQAPPPQMFHHQRFPPPPPRPPHYWDGGYGGNPHMMPHPPPHHRGGPPHDIYRPPPPHSFRTTTPDMSPAPSPHPTPPTTPPPPMMQPSPVRARPHLPNMYHGAPPPLRGDYHRMPPPHMHQGPPPHMMPRPRGPPPQMGPPPPWGDQQHWRH